ncbi:MAG: PEP-CTERM sorting domain-containing protein [Planctomycetaceae bacterium]|nr:PEP-CTERM sorting domain-containing protein [Planctomycetaceae bacterium]
MPFGSRKTVRVFVAILLFAGICASETITQTYGVFDVTFYNTGDTDGAKTGEQDWTSLQMADAASAAYEWQSHISNTPGRQIQVHMFWGEMDSLGTGVLGGSASYRIGNGTQIWNMGEYVWKEGLDPGLVSTGFDTTIQYDVTAAGLNWNFGSAAPASGTIDFRSIVTHEFGHSLGWDSTYDKDYDDWGWMYVNYPYGSYYGLSAWDKNLVDSAGNRAISGGTGTPSNFDQADNPIFFDGANAVALYGDLVPIYAPSTYNSGSSLVHLDESALGNLLMSPFVASGQMIRTVSELEWAMMKDMGWTIVPEPSSILLMLSAFGLIRHKRK